jgi:PAS domain S-box-containing protein
MELQQYDVPVAGRGFIQKYWLPTNTPVLNELGEIDYIIHKVEDVTAQQQAKQALLENQELLQVVFESAPLSLSVYQILYDSAGQVEDFEIRMFNSFTVRTTGVSDYLGKRYSQVFPHTIESGVLDRFKQVATSGQTADFELWYEGESMQYWFRFIAVRQQERLVVITEDITERKKSEAALRESEARFRLMVDTVPLSIWITDAKGRVEYLNKHWCDYCGVAFDLTTADEIASRFLHPEDGPKVITRFHQAMEEGTPWEIEQRNRSAEGQYRWFLNRAQPYHDPETGQLIKWLGIGIDIHERKQVQEHQKRLTEQLAAANQDLLEANQQIQTSNAELKRANQRLSHINADLDNFIYTASHDLKAPIVNIEGLLKVLTRRLGNLSEKDESLEHLLSLMEASVLRFKETIRDLTDITRISKQLDGEPELVELQEVVEATVLDLQPSIQASGAVIEWDFRACPKIAFPRKNLQSVLYNLLSNALKYRHPERLPTVHLTCRQERSYLLLGVQDNGLGMDTRDPEKIFGMFKRLHTHVEGTGIGLYIIRKMIENAGGRIEVESQVGIGSTFRIYFPTNSI